MRWAISTDEKLALLAGLTLIAGGVFALRVHHAYRMWRYPVPVIDMPGQPMNITPPVPSVQPTVDPTRHYKGGHWTIGDKEFTIPAQGHHTLTLNNAGPVTSACVVYQQGNDLIVHCK